jgi:AraC family transcriptional regulator
MSEGTAMRVEEPRIENGKTMIIAGMQGHYTYQTIREIPALWQKFVPYMDRIAGRVGHIEYGLCWDLGTGGIDYLAGEEISSADGLPPELRIVRIPAMKYAVFGHREHVSRISETCGAAFEWLKKSRYQNAVTSKDVPNFFERYGQEFDPKTGMGGIEVWVPMRESQ